MKHILFHFFSSFLTPPNRSETIAPQKNASDAAIISSLEPDLVSVVFLQLWEDVVVQRG